MTDADDAPGTRRARVESDVADPEAVAAAIAPDDTDDIDTRVEDGRVVTEIERPTTGGLAATLDDSVVALDVAIETLERARTAGEQYDDRHDTNTP